MILRNALIAGFALIVNCSVATAWDGTNSNTGSSIEIDRGQLVRSGQTIEVYDSSEGSKTYDVDSISRSGGAVEIEATDTSTGETTTLEMNGD
jgi:hypothetical protein